MGFKAANLTKRDTPRAVIKLFVSDIDGCLAEPYHSVDLSQYVALAAHIKTAGRLHNHDTWPAFSMCSGRAYSYVEAMTQMLGVQMPVLFESGGGMFDPVATTVTWHPHFSADIEAQIRGISRWLIEECIPGTGLMYDFGKRTQAGVVAADTEEITAQLPGVKEYVAKHFPDLCVFHTSISIDIVAATITKQQGLQWLGEQLGCTLEEMAYIGDTNGDLGALASIGHSFAPANATEIVKQQVHMVTDPSLTEGVLAAYRWCQARNERHAEQVESL